MKPVRVAVVGCGHLGAIHARLLSARPDAALVAVVDPSPLAVGRVAAEYGCQSLSAPESLPGMVDAVVVAAPTGLHADVSLPLLEAGIDLLVEKPIATSTVEAQSIRDIAARRGRVVAVGHVERFNPAWREAVVGVEGVIAVTARRMAPFTFRSLDVGVVLDLMIHDIDLVLSLDPGPLENVEAVGVVATGGHEDAVRARLRFASGLIADLSASRIAPGLDRSIEMWAETGFVSADFQTRRVTRTVPSAEVAGGGWAAHLVPSAEREGLKSSFFDRVLPTTVVEPPAANAIQMEHDDFFSAVRGRHDPLVSATAGLDALRVAERILAKLRTVPLGTTSEVRRPLEERLKRAA
ncbi:MAG: Gfo/Idh/MocA family oxidoreductase [Planctomycetaceae bacterium]